MFTRYTFSAGPAPPRPPTDSYAVIEIGESFIPVYAWMAARVVAQLQRFWTPRWITFRDITGAVFTVRSKDIRSVASSSPKTRAMARAFYRARAQEQEEDPSWE